MSPSQLPYLFSLATRIINVASAISQKSKLSNNILSAVDLFVLFTRHGPLFSPEKFNVLTDPEPHTGLFKGFVDEILPRLSLNIHNPEFSSSREDTPGPVIVVAAAQLSGGGGGNQLAVTGGLARNTGKRVGANVWMIFSQTVYSMFRFAA
jgi:hypothetical protein